MIFFLKKLCYLLVSLFFVISLTFVLMKSAPGDPFSDEKAFSKEVHDSLLEHYGLNAPLYKQYFRYLYSVLQWDLGSSIKYKNRSVNEIIHEGFCVSALLGTQALIVSLFFGISLGILAAIKQNRWEDTFAMVIAIIGISIPSFIFATLLQYVFAIKFGWVPIARWGTFSQTILPTIALAAMPTAFLARLTRSNMIEVLHQDYIKTARAKGLPRSIIITKHCLRNALPPLLPYFGHLVANILTGSFVIEKIFSIPGLGQWFVNGIGDRDYPVIMGTIVFYSLILLSALFLSDLAYAYLDPRIKQRELH